MTTAAQIVDAARAEVASGEIYRANGNWDGYVSIQQSEPFGPDRFGTMHVEHCGISAGRVLWKAGGDELVAPVIDAIQYAPALVAHSNRDKPEAGAIGALDWEADGNPDHVVICLDADDDRRVATTAEWNTTADGGGAIYERAYSLFAAVVQLADDVETPTQAAAAPTPAAPAPTPVHPNGEDVTILKVPNEDNTAHDMFYLIGGVLLHADPLIRMDGNPTVVWFNSLEEFRQWYASYCHINRLNALTGGYL